MRKDMNIKRISDYYITKSLSLAAAIQAVSSAPLDHIEFTPGDGLASFHFDRSQDPQFDEITARYWSRQLPIDAATYFEALKYLKSRLYEERPLRG